MTYYLEKILNAARSEFVADDGSRRLRMYVQIEVSKEHLQAAVDELKSVCDEVNRLRDQLEARQLAPREALVHDHRNWHWHDHGNGMPPHPMGPTREMP